MTNTSTETTTTHTSTVYASNAEAVTKRFGRLASKAMQFGVEQPTITIGEIEERKIPVTHDGVHVRDVWVQTRDITVTMPAKIVIEGWTILAAIDIDEDGNNIIRSISDHDLPEWVRTVERGRCDHCHTNRRRKTLVVMSRPSSALDQHLLYQVIGTSCTRDFLGHDLGRYLGYHNVLAGYDIPGIPEDIDESDAGYGPHMIGVHDFVAAAADVISRTGYVRSREPGETKESAAYYYWNPGKIDEQLGHQLTSPVSATDAIEWAKGLDGDSDFEYNLRTLASSQALNSRHYGIAAYIPEGYRRHLAKEAQKLVIAEDDPGHWGTVGERELLTATVTDVNLFDTDYGVSAWIKAIAESGHSIQWKSSGRFPEVDTTITGKATVKGHDEWNDRAVTTVQRWSWKLEE